MKITIEIMDSTSITLLPPSMKSCMDQPAKAAVGTSAAGVKHSQTKRRTIMIDLTKTLLLRYDKNWRIADIKIIPNTIMIIKKQG